MTSPPVKRARAALGAAALLMTVVAHPSEARAADPTTRECLSANEGWLKLLGDHKLREARAQLLVCAAATCPTEIRTECLAHVNEVNASIPTIVFHVTDPKGGDLAQTRVSIDGQPAIALDGSALPLDPGEHKYVFDAPGYRQVEKVFVLLEGQKDRRESIALNPVDAPAEPAPAAAPSSPASASPASASTAPSPPPSASAAAPATHATPEPASSSSSQRTIALVVGGVGVVALGVGAVFGLLATSAKNDYEQHCGSNIGAPEGSCNQQGVSGHDDTVTKATISTVFFVGGAVAAGAGLVLFFTAPKSAPSASVGVTPGGVLVQGRF